MKFLTWIGFLCLISSQASAVIIHITPDDITKYTGKTGSCAQEMSGNLTTIVYLEMKNNDDVSLRKMVPVAPARPEWETYRVTFALGNEGDGYGLSGEATYLVNFDSRCRIPMNGDKREYELIP